MTSQRDLGARLSELEPVNPNLRGRYEQALQDAFERKLNTPMKVFIGCVGAMSIVIAVFLGSLAVVHRELPALARIGLGGGAVFALAWTALAGWTLRKGAWYGKIQPTAAAALGWVFAVFLETLFLVLAPLAPDPYQWTVALFMGLAILVGAGFQLVTTCIQQSELRMRETILRMEYRLAELAEQMAQNKRDPPGVQ
jgi:MFS family permease